MPTATCAFVLFQRPNQYVHFVRIVSDEKFNFSLVFVFILRQTTFDCDRFIEFLRRVLVVPARNRSVAFSSLLKQMTVIWSARSNELNAFAFKKTDGLR